MPQPFEVANDHLLNRTRLTSAGTQKALRLWSRMNVADLDRSWDEVAPQLVTLVTAAQVTAAKQSAPYMAKIDKHYGNTSVAELYPEAFGGVMSDGRDIGPAMFGAVTTTKGLIGSGRPTFEAFQVGAAFLSTIVGSAISDAGRSADGTLATAKSYTRYVRVLSPGACSRCAILAGVGSYRKPFKRHPRCKCQSFPVEGGDLPDGFHQSPSNYFESLSKAEQDRVFTVAGAQALRDGADFSAVVNARRGYFGSAVPGAAPRRLRPITIGRKADGSPLTVYATSEGTTARGAFARAEGAAKLSAAKDGRYRRTTTIRLMPEQIYKMAGSDTARAIELLRRYGYIV